ncbi:MAG: WD40 repeat domain-containing serine/threonine protein kinase [Planctomycetota bacterium]
MTPNGDLEELGQRFVLEGVLGQGGMGTVHRALDPATGRHVALKTLRLPGEVQRERFRREAEITANLSHPGIVGVHACGFAGATPWIAYELVPGARPLDEVFEGLPLRGRVELLAQVAAALAYAHARGVVHRDVKPENVLVGEDGRARLADFGLARAVDAERLTATGAWVGTPHTMAPEQVAASESRPIGPGADVWALGVLLYLALTDRYPFDAPSLVQLAARICAGAMPPPHTVAPEAPRALEAVCLQALRVPVEERYPDAEAFGADLEAWLAGRRPSAAGGLAPLRQHARPVAAGVLLALGGAALGLALGRGPAPERDELPANEAERPTPSASATDPGEQAWRALRDLPTWRRPEALAGFQAAHPTHARAAEARAQRLALAREPLLELRHGAAREVRSRFAESHGSLELLTYGRGGLAWWDPADGAAPRARALASKEVMVTLALPVGPPLDPERQLLLRALAGQLLLFSREGGREAVARPLAERKVGTVARSHDGRWLALAAAPTVRLLDAASFAQVSSFGSLRMEVQDLAFDPREELLFVVSGTRVEDGGGATPGGRLEAYRLPGGELVWALPMPPRPEFVVASPDGALVACGCTMGDLFLVDRQGDLRALVAPDEGSSERTDAPFRRQLAHAGTLRAGWFSPDGTQLVTVSVAPGPEGDVGEVRRWQVGTKRQLGWLRCRGLGLLSVDVDPQRRLVLLGTRQGLAQLWSLDALGLE